MYIYVYVVSAHAAFLLLYIYDTFPFQAFLFTVYFITQYTIHSTLHICTLHSTLHIYVGEYVGEYVPGIAVVVVALQNDAVVHSYDACLVHKNAFPVVVQDRSWLKKEMSVSVSVSDEYNIYVYEWIRFFVSFRLSLSTPFMIMIQIYVSFLYYNILIS